MSFSTVQGFHQHVGSGRVQGTLAVIINNQFHLLQPISASFPLSGSQCSCRDTVESRALMWFSTRSLGYKVHLHLGTCPLRFCRSCFVYPLTGCQHCTVELSHAPGTSQYSNNDIKYSIFLFCYFYLHMMLHSTLTSPLAATSDHF